MTDLGGTTLIRDRVLEKRRQRLYGDVVLSDGRISSRMVFAIGGLSLGLISWATTATYPRTEKVPGIVVTTATSAKVFAARIGVAERVYVREGARVRRGQPLLFIGVDVRDNARHGAADESLSALDHQSKSIELQLDASGQTLADEALRLDQALTINASEQGSLRRQWDIQTSIVQSKAEEFERIGPAAEKGYISRFEMDRRRQALLSERQRAEQLSQQITQLDGRRQELASQRRQLPIQRQRQSAELQGALGSISQQRARAKVEVGYTVVAPIDGQVTALQVATGRGVDPRVPLMTVLPTQAAYRVQLFAPSKAIGFIRAGQPVRLSYDAFPYRQFGTFGGSITSISGTAYAPSEIDAPLKIEEAVYPISVGLVNEIVPAFGRPLPLQSGMTVSASIILERRSFFDWLLQPLNAVRKRT